MADTVIIYRISDSGYKKEKPTYINNENCLQNAVNIFKNATFYIIADNVSQDTYTMITKYINPDSIEKVSVGHGAGTFNLALDKALTFPDDTIIYFLENDYIHKIYSDVLLEEAIEMGADYCSLYDHPDKYVIADEGGNPYVDKDGGEVTKVYITKSSHWKLTNSTTMTFASKVKTIKKDIAILRKWTQMGKCPRDFDMFIHLRKEGRSLLTPIPGYSTHGDIYFLSPLDNWEQIWKNTRNQ